MGEVRYKPLMKYACFGCRKCFKRSGLWTRAARLVPQGDTLSVTLKAFEAQYKNACPQCGVTTQFVGEAFKAPRQSDIRSWERLSRFYACHKEPGLDARHLRLHHDDLWYAYNTASDT
jgi:hypothetical protein